MGKLVNLTVTNLDVFRPRSLLQASPLPVFLLPDASLASLLLLLWFLRYIH
jgi:hypothetical protein